MAIILIRKINHIPIIIILDVCNSLLHQQQKIYLLAEYEVAYVKVAESVLILSTFLS